MNEVQVELKLYTLQQTEMDLNEFMNKFNDCNIVDTKLQVTLSDGSIHYAQVYDYLEAVIKSFLVDGEETIQEDINNKEKIAKLENLATNKNNKMFTKII
jgi:hypothetical protein